MFYPLNLIRPSGVCSSVSKNSTGRGDKAANNAVVVCGPHFINALNQEFGGSRAYQIHVCILLHKRLIKVRFIDNSSSCTTTELTGIKSHVIIYFETVHEPSNKNGFGQ